jgi:signal transduction histidine kinase
VWENARRSGRAAGKPDAEVRLSLQRQGLQRKVMLAVEDRGPGVPPALREQIFEPFYRLPGASESEGGVGLGLSLVRTIVERHGGTVHCEDRAGGGARFVVLLPVAEAA